MAQRYEIGRVLHKYISPEELESIRNDKDLRNEAAKRFAESVKFELAKIEKEQRRIREHSS